MGDGLRSRTFRGFRPRRLAPLPLLVPSLLVTGLVPGHAVAGQEIPSSTRPRPPASRLPDVRAVEPAARSVLVVDLRDAAARRRFAAEVRQVYGREAELAGERAADPAKRVPGETSLVHLAKHVIRLEVDPELELVLGGVPLAKLKLVARFSCTIEGAALSVRDAAIVAVAPGRIALEAKLDWGRKTLPLPLRRKTIDLPGRIDVTPPVSLAPPAPAPSPTPP